MPDETDCDFFLSQKMRCFFRMRLAYWQSVHRTQYVSTIYAVVAYSSQLAQPSQLEHLLPSFLFLFLNRKPITCKLFRNRNRNSKLVTVNTVVSISISYYEFKIESTINNSQRWEGYDVYCRGSPFSHLSSSGSDLGSRGVAGRGRFRAKSSVK